METIKIAHLYYDLMNLYGEHGNILALAHHLEEHKVRVITHYLSVDDKIDFNKYDIFYIGSGNKESFDIVLNDILKRKEEIKEAIDNNKFFFVTGNALDLFGKSYHTLYELEKETLDILKYEAHETDFRIVGEQVYKFPKLKEEVIGFENRNSVLKMVKENHLFDVIEGTGYVPKSVSEGIKKKNFYGTYLLGPIFIRNPYFTEYIVKEILNHKKIPYKFYKDEAETKAYHEYNNNRTIEKTNP